MAPCSSPSSSAAGTARVVVHGAPVGAVGPGRFGDRLPPRWSGGNLEEIKTRLRQAGLREIDPNDPLCASATASRFTAAGALVQAAEGTEGLSRI
jgi:hypothetical protein